MKLYRRDLKMLLGIVIGMLISVGAGAQNPSFKQPITIGLDANYAPLQSVDKNGLPQGYDIQFTRALMNRMGVKFYYVPNTWDKVAASVLKGDIDLAMMVYSPYRKDSIFYSRPIFRLYYQVVYRKGDYDNFDFRNIKGKTFAFLQSRPVGELMEREGGIGVHVLDLDQAFQELADGKYDAIICYRYQASYYIENFYRDKLKAEEITMQPREYCYVSHNQKLIEAISREMATMEVEGVIDDIYTNITTPSNKHIPRWVWYLFIAMGLVFVGLYIFLLYRSRRELKLANAMLETNYNILEMSHMELEDTNRQLIVANERAEESSKMKSNFIKQISHEIRTPLNILSGFTQVITTPGLELNNEEKAQIVQGIVENTNRITGLVNKMLELSDAGSQSVIERNDQALALQIANNAVITSCIADTNDLKFELQTESQAEEISLNTNLSSAVRALALLLDNARKFTAKSGDRRVRLCVSATPSTVEFAVEDNGIGVPAKDAEYIFEEFVQLDEYYEGTGIGLTIARGLARRLGGDITLDTTYSPGARFVFTLPR